MRTSGENPISEYVWPRRGNRSRARASVPPNCLVGNRKLGKWAVAAFLMISMMACGQIYSWFFTETDGRSLTLEEAIRISQNTNLEGEARATGAFAMYSQAARCVVTLQELVESDNEEVAKQSSDFLSKLEGFLKEK